MINEQFLAHTAIPYMNSDCAFPFSICRSHKVKVYSALTFKQAKYDSFRLDVTFQILNFV